MPFVEIITSAELPSEDQCGVLLKRVSKLASEHLGKAEQYVMTRFAPRTPMSFDGDLSPCAFVDVRAIGAPTADRANGFCEAVAEVLRDVLDVDPSRTYVVFGDVERSHWGFRGQMMG